MHIASEDVMKCECHLLPLQLLKEECFGVCEELIGSKREMKLFEHRTVSQRCIKTKWANSSYNLFTNMITVIKDHQVQAPYTVCHKQAVK